MGRLRADLHPEFEGHPMLKKVRNEITSRTPSELVRLLFEIEGGHEALADYCKEQGIPVDTVTSNQIRRAN